MANLICKTTLKNIYNTKTPLKVTSVILLQKCGIMGKSMKSAVPCKTPKPAPFPYETKDYTWFRSLFDRTTHRIDENSKVIVVEGPIAAGKTAFAQNLAAELEMKHFPEANMDLHYIRPNGVDLREFDCLVPEDTRTFDHTDFCKKPCHRLAANFQLMMYSARYSQYVDALTHLFNTGQGVVLERCPYSDYVFLEAMFSQKFISKGARSVYYDIRNNTINELMRPHLVIYLDMPVDTVIRKIRDRNCTYEFNSQALTRDYLTKMEHEYKHKYLRDISSHAELLVYDWSSGGDVEVIIEDIERLNFEQYTEREEPKMKDWRLPREVEWADKRMLYTNGKYHLMNLFNIPRCDVPELITSPDDAFDYNAVVMGDPRFEYVEGYNKGDGSTLLKTKVPKYYEYI